MTNVEYEDRCRGEDVGELLALTEGGAGVAQQPQSEQAAEKPYRKLGIETSDHDGLRDHVSSQAGHHDRAEEQPQPAPAMVRRGVIRYRRSSRCLHATHKVARGKAWRRPFPIG